MDALPHQQHSSKLKHSLDGGFGNLNSRHAPKHPGPMIGVPERSAMPLIQGLSWLGVEVTAREPSLCWTNQAQPEPKRVSAALVNASLNESKLPNERSIARLNDSSEN